MRCDLCETKGCHKGEPCKAFDSIPLYSDPLELKMMRAAASVESEFYGEYNRLQEIVVYGQRMGYKKLGVAFCIGLSSEAKKICSLLSKHFEVVSVCCKTSGMLKSDLNEPTSGKVGAVSCNPIEQARILNDSGVDAALMLGLCVGHDALFIKHINSYVIPIAVKDRVTGHNPLAAIYCSAIAETMKRKGF